ncbi:MAG: MFS transporter [Bilophila wadsworthia]
MVVVCFTLAEATMTPVAGVLSDRFGRMAVLLPALLVFAGGGFVPFAESWRDVLICRVIQGIGAGPLGVLYTILAADMVDEKHLPRIMGRLTAVSSLGTIVYPVLWPARRMVMAGAFRLHAGPADSGFVPHGDAGKTARGDGLAALLEANGEYPT